VPTWALAILTLALCIVTSRSANKALREAARLRRESVGREVNAAAHRAASTAERVGQLAASIPHVRSQLAAIAGTMPAEEGEVAIVAKERVARTEVIKQHALDIVFASPENSDERLTSSQRRLDEHLVQLEVMKEAVSGELELLRRRIDGAERAAAAEREVTRLNQRRVDYEMGQCNKLIFILGQMLSSLEDIKDNLFIAPKEKFARDPRWDEIGALVGGPIEGPTFDIGEYSFLLEDHEPVDQAPEMLARIYYAASNYQLVLSRVNERSALWHEYNEHRASASPFVRGEEASARMTSSGALVARLKEHTEWLAEDLSDWILKFRSLFPDLYKVFGTKYPGRDFIRLWPVKDSRAPAL
jgi:hypothetical protein